MHSPIARFVLGWLAAVTGAAAGATGALTVLALMGSGRAGVDSIVVVLIFSLAYSAIGATALGPPTLLVLLRLRLYTRTAFAAAGGLVGLVATAATIYLSHTNWNEGFVEMGAAAGLCGALAFHRVWFGGSPRT
jgi:hypothetical protein